MTISEIQTAICKGKYVYIKGHNEGRQITLFQVTNRFITIRCENVRRFKLGALDHFLRNAVII